MMAFALSLPSVSFVTFLLIKRVVLFVLKMMRISSIMAKRSLRPLCFVPFIVVSCILPNSLFVASVR
jgi:hypothetical protein